MFTVERLPIENAKDLWKNLWTSLGRPGPFSTWEWNSVSASVFTIEPKDQEILLIKKASETVAVVPLKTRNSLTTWLSNEEVTDYLDILCGEENKQKSWETILRYFKSQGKEMIHLKNIPQDSKTREVLQQIGSQIGFNVTEIEEDVVPYIALPKTVDEYLSSLSRKDRHELRRKIRRFEAATQGKWELRKTSKDSLDEDLQNFFRLFRMRREEKRAFLTPTMEKFFCEITKSMFSLSLLDLSILCIEGKCSAGTIGFFDDSVYYLYNSAFDPSFVALSTGLILKMELIKESIAKGRKIYDFMQGNERYKYQLGGVNRYVYTIRLEKKPS